MYSSKGNTVYGWVIDIGTIWNSDIFSLYELCDRNNKKEVNEIMMLDKWMLNYNENLLDIKRMWESLSNSNGSKIVFDKIIKMEPQFFYQVFHDFIPGFHSAYTTSETLSVLINCLLDDDTLYSEIVEVERVEGIKRNEIQFNTSERGTVVYQKELLRIIDKCEKDEIDYIHKCYYVDDTLEDFDCFKDTVITFNVENQRLLNPELYEYLIGGK